MNKDIDTAITKSLDDIDQMVNKALGDTTLSKSEEPTPEEVSNDTPTEQEEEQQAPAKEEQDPAGEGTEETSDTDEDDEEGTEKSLKDNLNANDSVRKALEVSDFLKSLVDTLSNTIDGQRADINKSLQAAIGTQDTLVKSFQGMIKAQGAILQVQANLGKSLQDIGTRLAKIESQPQMRKSIASSATKPIEKSFDASAGSAPKTEPNTLSKSVASARLAEGVAAGDMSLTTDVLALESTGNFDSLSQHGRTFLGLK